MQGGDSIGYYDTDTDYLFRQESYFQYLFGVSEPGFFGIINLKDNSATLFAPRLPEGTIFNLAFTILFVDLYFLWIEYAVWMGNLLSPDDYKSKYEVEQVFYVDQIVEKMSKSNPSLILTLVRNT